MNKQNRIITLLLLLVILVIGLVASRLIFKNDNNERKENNSNYQENNDDQIYVNNSYASYSYDIANPDELYNRHEYIAIIFINKVNESSCYLEKQDLYTEPFTPVVATVKKVLKGTITDEQIDIIKPGGTVPYEEYIKHMYPEQAEKFSKGFENTNKEKVKIKDMVYGDIEIEEGKTYLAYFESSNEYHKDNTYILDAFEYGLREIKYDGEITLVKNNKTGEYENLKDTVSPKLAISIK